VITLATSRCFRRAGFTLTELMMAVAIFVIGGLIVFPLFDGDLSLFARNFSINKSNNSLRWALQKLKKDIDMSVEPPTLMSYSGSTTSGTLTALTSSTVSAQAILLWVNLGPAYDLQPSSGSTINPSAGVTLQRHIASSGDPTPSSVVPQIGDRLMIMDPSPYSTGMPETVTMGSGSITKPGRAVTSVSIASTDTTSPTFKVGLNLTNPLPTGIPASETAYFVREVAYVAYPVNAGGNAVERDLLYFPTTANMNAGQTLIRDLDPLPQEVDANTSAVIQPFNYYSGRGNLSVLNVILPIRAMDYVHALNDVHLGAAVTNTSGTEFDVYLRSAPQMGIKARLD
jgi:prepilin-type N-terminal cleavage/methylation domain-containing protein